MKTKNIILSFLSLILVILLCSYDLNQVKAEEDTWYSQAAENAGNPILLEDNQYFQGISINSNLISDLTFMEIPFNKYLITVDDKVQIIAFTEAMYRHDGKKESELVMYVYYPDKYNLDNKYIYTDINIESQKYLYENHYFTNSNDRTNYRVKWTKVSSYGNITKYSYSKYNGVGSESTIYNNYFKKKLLNEYNSSSVNTEVQTIFSAKINNSITSSGTSLVFDDDYVYAAENFQFIYAKHTNLPEGIMTLSATEPAKEHVTACVGTKTDTVTVTGETRKFRYKTSEASGFKFVGHVCETEYTDIFYLFFNVKDDDSGKHWGSEKYITEVSLRYFEASVVLKEYKEFTSSSVRKYTKGYTVEFYDGTGQKVTTKQEENVASKLSGSTLSDYVTSIIENTKIDSKIIQTDIIKPEKLDVVYLENSSHNEWVSYTIGFFKTRKASYLTLFETNSEEFKELYDPNSTSSDLISKYNFGLVYGDENGYPCSSAQKTEITWAGLVSENTKIDTYYHVEVIDMIDIEYEENGEIHRVTVSEDMIDNSNINKPIDQEDDFWYDEPGPDQPKDDNGFWKFIQKIINFFAVTIPKWLDDNKDVLLGVVATVGIILGVSWVIRTFNTNYNEESNKEK